MAPAESGNRSPSSSTWRRRTPLLPADAEADLQTKDKQLRSKYRVTKCLTKEIKPDKADEMRIKEIKSIKKKIRTVWRTKTFPKETSGARPMQALNVSNTFWILETVVQTISWIEQVCSSAVLIYTEPQQITPKFPSTHRESSSPDILWPCWPGRGAVAPCCPRPPSSRARGPPAAASRSASPAAASGRTL